MTAPQGLSGHDDALVHILLRRKRLPVSQLADVLSSLSSAAREGRTVTLQGILVDEYGFDPDELRQLAEASAVDLDTLDGEDGDAALAPRIDPFPVPSTVGPFEILERIAIGGMGIVYQARNLENQRTVAIKLLRDPDASPEMRSRFLAEARILSKLPRHPNIVSVHSAGRLGEMPYIEMDFVRGAHLKAHLTRKNPTAESAAQMLVMVASAVTHLHEHGVVHRDLKPENVLINRKSVPRLTDFGLARAAFDERSRMTRTGTPIGTPIYMSPEQICAIPEQIDYRTDIYSFGVMLYEVLAGRPPFQGATLMELYCRIREAPLDPPSTIREVPPALESVCLKAMARYPIDRYQSMVDLAADLQAALDDPQFRARQSHKAAWASRRQALRTHARWIALGLSLVLLGTVAAWTFLRHRRREAIADRARAVREAIELGQLQSAEQQYAELERLWVAAGRPQASDRGPVRAALVLRLMDEAALSRTARRFEAATAALDAARRVAGEDHPGLAQERRQLAAERGRVLAPPLLDRLRELLLEGQLDAAAATLATLRSIAPDAPVCREATRELIFARSVARAADTGEGRPLIAALEIDPPAAPRQGWILLGCYAAGDTRRRRAFSRAAQQDGPVPALIARALDLRLDLFDRVADVLKTMPPGRAGQALMATMAGKPPEVRKRLFELVLTLYPQDPHGVLTRASGLPRGVVEELDLAFAQEAHRAIDEARGLLARNNPATRQRALALLDRAVLLAPTSRDVRLGRATLLYHHAARQAGDPAMRTLTADLDQLLKQRADDPDALYWRALTRSRLGQLREALVDLDRLLGVQPEHKDGRLHRAVFRIRTGRRAEARRDLERLRQKAPDVSGSYLWLAHLAYLDRRFPDAVRDLNAGLRLLGRARQSASTERRLLAKCLYRLGKVADARRQLQRDIDIRTGHDDNSCAVAIWIGVASRDRSRQLAALAQHIDAKRRAAPDQLLGRAAWAQAQGEHRRAIGLLTVLGKRFPYFEDADLALRQRAVSHLALGEKPPARQCLEQALKINPQLPGADVLRKRLGS